MGSGPACRLVVDKPCAAMILMTPYRSIKSVSREHVGCLACCAPNIFNNLESIPKIQVPTIIIHGQKDTVINCQNSKYLFDASGAKPQEKYLISPPHMTHNKYNLISDLLSPVYDFLSQHGLLHKEGSPIINLSCLNAIPEGNKTS